MKQQNGIEKNQTTTEADVSVRSLEFGEVVVYNEMADEPSVKINLLEQIHAQLNQLEELNQRRQFLMREITDYIK